MTFRVNYNCIIENYKIEQFHQTNNPTENFSSSNFQIIAVLQQAPHLRREKLNKRGSLIRIQYDTATAKKQEKNRLKWQNLYRYL